MNMKIFIGFAIGSLLSASMMSTAVAQDTTSNAQSGIINEIFASGLPDSDSEVLAASRRNQLFGLTPKEAEKKHKKAALENYRAMGNFSLRQRPPA